MIELSSKILDEIHKHIEAELPREACGVVIIELGKYKYIPCKNISQNLQDFVIDPVDWANAEDMGSIVLVVHSHPNISPEPTQADLVGCENSKLPWMIINWPSKEFRYIEPSGYEAPLIGRVYVQGIIDCLTLVQDYYWRNLRINLQSPSFRTEKWWERGENLYVQSAPENGFYQVDKPEKHDVILMQVMSSVPNHAAVWLGDGKIMHHQLNRLSSIDIYGGWYQKVTTHIFRHKDTPR